MHTQQIPLSQLQPSAKNVRRTEQPVAQLARSIAEHGLIQSLAVEKVNGHFEVVAGGRRLRALQQLVKEKKLDADAPITCTVVEADKAVEVSLAENAFRLDMHPADQFEAFAAVIAEGKSEAQVAERFSVTPLFVRQRMKLARVSPAVLAAYRAEKIDLDVVEAFTLTDDHVEQDRVLKGSKHLYAYHVREALTSTKVSAGDRRIKALGGLDAYEKAGGVVVRDLFSRHEGGYAADSKHVDKLVAELIGVHVAKLRKAGWSFVDVGDEQAGYKYSAAPGKGKEVDKSKAGAFVSLGWDGKVEVRLGVLRPGSKVSADGSVKPGKAAPKKNPAELSFAQLQHLQAYRDTEIAQQLEKTPRVALATLAAALGGKLLSLPQQPIDELVRVSAFDSFSDRLPHQLRAQHSVAEADRFAKKRIQAIRDRIPKGTSLLEWLLASPESETHNLLALCAARALMAVDFQPGRKNPGMQLAALAGVDFTEKWWPTGDWLAAQPTAYIMAAVKEACGAKVAAELAKTKGKAAIAGKAWRLLKDAGWKPAPLRPHTAAPAKKAAKK